MITHTIEVKLSDEALQRLKERVRRTGGDEAEYISALVARDLRTPSLREILAPFRRQVWESGITDDELDVLFEEARGEAWQEREKKVGRPAR